MSETDAPWGYGVLALETAAVFVLLTAVAGVLVGRGTVPVEGYAAAPVLAVGYGAARYAYRRGGPD